MSSEILAPVESPLKARPESARLDGLWRTQCRIWFAIMLRDMRSRFFGNGLGYVFLVAWPIAHMSFLIVINSFRSNATTYGDDSLVFLTVGFLPAFVFMYMSRYTVYAAIINLPLLSFPQVKPLDMLIGHSLLEIVNACILAILFVGALSLLGSDIVPRHSLQAFYAFGASVLLGLGFGVLNGVIAFVVRPWVTGYALVIIVTYFTCGALIPVEEMPDQVQNIFAYNPVLHSVEWMRSAYYDGYGAHILDKGYLLWCGIGSLAIGLVLERVLRGRILRT